jgi:predicted extracellular nuclease
LDNNEQPLFLDNKNRPMLTQKFALIADASELVVAVNHLKSKGSNCDSLNDPDTGDGQGNCNITRTRAASAIGQFLIENYGETPTLVIGDLNAYAKEDPLSTLAESGYINIFSTLNKVGQYSYIFAGELGQLDHALANASMSEKIIDASIWAINADEPRVLDYSTQYQNALQQAKFYAPDAYRSSDHDPVIIEINFSPKTLFGDFDNDQDIDKTDVSLLYQQIKMGTLTNMAYDFNQDGLLSHRDLRGFMKLCTRSRCAI